MATTQRGKTYEERKAEADARAKQLVSAIEKTGQKVTATTSPEVSKELGLKVISPKKEIVADYTVRSTDKPYVETTTLYQTTYGATGPSSQVKQLSPERVTREDFFSPSQVGSSVQDKSEYFQPVTSGAGDVIGYESEKYKQSVLAPKGFVYSREDLKTAEEKAKFYEMLFEPKKTTTKDEGFSVTRYGGVFGKPLELYYKLLDKAETGYKKYGSFVKEKALKVLPEKEKTIIGNIKVPSSEEFLQRQRTAETLFKPTLQIGAYATKLGTPLIALETASFVTTATKKEGREMFKKYPVETVVTGVVLATAVGVGAYKVAKGLTTQSRAISSVNKELKNIATGKTPFMEKFSTLSTKGTKAGYNFGTKIKTKVVAEIPSGKEIGLGKSKTLIFRDVIDTKKNIVERIILSKKYPEVKFKVFYDVAGDVAKVERFYSGKLISSDIFKVPKVTENVVQTIKTQSGFSIESGRKLGQFQEVKEIKTIEGPKFVVDAGYSVRGEQVARITKPARSLKYETGLALKEKEIDFKNWLVSKKTISTKISIGEPSAQEDVLAYRLYESVKGKPKLGFEGDIYRAPRSKQTIKITEVGESVLKSVKQPSSTKLFVQPIPTPAPLIFETQVPKFELSIPESRFSTKGVSSVADVTASSILSPKTTSVRPIGVSLIGQSKVSTDLAKSIRVEPARSIKTSPVIVTKELPSLKKVSKVEQVVSPIIESKIEQVVKSKSKTEQLVESKTKTEQIVEQMSKVMQKTTPVSTVTFTVPKYGSYIRPSLIEPLPNIKVPLGVPKVLSFPRAGFEVYVKRFGEFKKASGDVFDKLSAEKFGARIVSQTASATFKIKPVGFKANLKSFGGSSFTPLQSFMKKKKGGETFYIEPKEKRIKRGTKEIQEITLKGLRTLRKK